MSVPTEVKTTSFRFNGAVDRTAVAYLSLAVLYTCEPISSDVTKEASASPEFTVKNLWFSPKEEMLARKRKPDVVKQLVVKQLPAFGVPDGGPSDRQYDEFMDRLAKQSESSAKLTGTPGFPVFLGALERAADRSQERFSLVHEYAGIPLSGWISATQTKFSHMEDEKTSSDAINDRLKVLSAVVNVLDLACGSAIPFSGLVTDSILIHPVTRSATTFLHWNATLDEVSLHGERPIPFIGHLIRDLGFDVDDKFSLFQSWTNMLRTCQSDQKNTYDLLRMFRSHLQSLIS